MKTKIENLDDLKAERVRLKNQITISRLKLSQEFTGIKEELQPARQALNYAKNLLVNNNQRSSIVGMGLRFGVNAILRNTLLARASWITRLVVPYIANNFVSSYVAKNDDKIIENTIGWIKEKTTASPKIMKPKTSLAEKALLWVKKVTSDDHQATPQIPALPTQPTVIYSIADRVNGEAVAIKGYEKPM